MIRALACALAIAASLPGAGFAQPPAVHFDPLPDRIVQLLLWLADVHAGDVVYDLGCGDVRLVITAAKRFGARGVCVDSDRARIAASRAAAKQAGAAERVRFVSADLPAAPIGDATVVVLLLSYAANVQLRPKLLQELRPGTRVVSHAHGMGDWRPDLTAYVGSEGLEFPVYLWTVPAR